MHVRSLAPLPGWSHLEPRTSFCELTWAGCGREHRRLPVCVGGACHKRHTISCCFLSTYHVPGPILDTLTQECHLTLTPSPQGRQKRCYPMETEAQRGFCDWLKVTQLGSRARLKLRPTLRMGSLPPVKGGASLLGATPGDQPVAPKSLPASPSPGTEAVPSFPQLSIQVCSFN